MAAAVQRAKVAYESAASPGLDPDLDEALDLVVDRLACGVPIRAVLTELWRGGYRTGFLDGRVERVRAPHRAAVGHFVTEQLAKAA